MALQPGQFLGDVHALGEERHLLREAGRVRGGAAGKLGDARGEPVAIGFDRLGRQLADGTGVGLDGIEPGAQIPRQ